MIHIRTAEDLARALDSPLHPELRHLIATHAERLAEYPDFAFEELTEVLVIEAGEILDGICSVTGPAIVTEGAADFVFPAELSARHRDWFEVVFILSDDCFGLVLLIEVGHNTDAALLALCARELERYSPAAS